VALPAFACDMLLLLQVMLEQTDGQTNELTDGWRSNHCIDPALHTMQAMPKILNVKTLYVILKSFFKELPVFHMVGDIFQIFPIHVLQSYDNRTEQSEGLYLPYHTPEK